MKITKRSAFIFITIIATIALDQISKVLVRKYVALRSSTSVGDTISLIGDYFTMMNVENKGAFLGMGSELNDTLRLIFLLILPIVVLVFVLRHVLKDKSLDNWSLFAFASIIGGGIANVFDRIAFGKVTDFLYIQITETIRTGIFNLADVSVSTGMVILVIVMLKKKKTDVQESEEPA